MDRSKQIVRVSWIGVAANVALAALKAFVGIVSGSIAVTLDAVNNMSDVFSSVVTIVGTRLANRPPDRKHPYGHGRIEYVASVTIAVIILLAGVSALREAVESFLHPKAPDYTVVSMAIIGAAVIVKFLLGGFVKRAGEKYRSDSLVASGTDAFFDAVISLSTLVGALASRFLSWNLEGILGVAISVLILKAGVEILLDSLSSIIGSRVDGELTASLRKKLYSYDEVLGVYDLILHRYGPEKLIGSVHIEVSDSLRAREIHRLTRKITEEIYLEFGIVMTIGIYASNDENPAFQKIRQDVESIAGRHKGVLGVHGFYVDADTSRITFDLLVDFDADSKTLYREVQEEVSALYPDYRFDIVLDSDFSD